MSLAWDTAVGTNVSGYYLYYGTTSSNYSNRIDVGTNTVVTITGLSGRSVPFYFAATAYNPSRVESPPSNQATFITSSNAGPTLASVPSRLANVNSLLVVTNSASDTDLPVKKLTFSLDAGTPSTVRIDPNTGRILWVPRVSDGGKTNFFNVRVSDGGAPTLYDTQSIPVIVSNAVQVSLGSTIVALGQTSSVPVTVESSADVTNVTFLLDTPPGRMTNLTVQSLIPASVSVVQASAGVGRYTITLRSLNGQVIQGLQDVAQVNFTATPNKPSVFATISASAVAATQSGGATVPVCLGSANEVVLVGAESLVKTIVKTNAQRDLFVYGPVGKSYQIETGTNAASTAGWTVALTTGLMTSSLYQTYTNFAPANVLKYYRARGL